MYYELLKQKKPLDMEQYSLKDLALYFEKFDGYVCKITTSLGTIRFKFSIDSFPHLIGMQYAFRNRKDRFEYKGRRGFEKVKNGEVTYEDLKHIMKTDTKVNFSWKNIADRIKYLPMFLNSIDKKTKLCTSLNVNNPERATHIKGTYFLYRELYDGKAPMFSLKPIGKSSAVIETFVVDDDKSIIKGLKPIKIIDIELIDPLENTSPILEKDKVMN